MSIYPSATKKRWNWIWIGNKRRAFPLSERTVMLLRMPKWPLFALALVACSRRPAPVMQITDDSVPGLIEVELRRPAELPGKVLDEDQVEDPEWGDALSSEVDVELQVDPDSEEQVLAQLRARDDVIFAEPVVNVQALWQPDDPDFSKQWHLKAAGAGRRHFARHCRRDSLGGRSRRARVEPFARRRRQVAGDGSRSGLRAQQGSGGGVRGGQLWPSRRFVSGRLRWIVRCQRGGAEGIAGALQLVRPRGGHLGTRRRQDAGRRSRRAAADARRRGQAGLPLVPGHQHGHAARRGGGGAGDVAGRELAGCGGAAAPVVLEPGA